MGNPDLPFGEGVQEIAPAKGFSKAFVLKEPLAVPHQAREFKARGYFLEMVTAVDTTRGLRLLYVFNRFDGPARTALYVDVAYSATVPTISGVFAGALWFESEVYDLFGITFDKHPDLKRLLTPEGMVGFPLLKSWQGADS
jgi:NADH:ubiquinone oxidoreductase subunit C